MQFVSLKSFKDQVKDICKFFTENYESLKQEEELDASLVGQLKEMIKSSNWEGIVKFIIGHKKDIYLLPTSYRQTPLTFQRTVLLILPLISELDKEDKNIEATLKECCDLITESTFSLSIKVEALLQLFNSVRENSPNRRIMFTELMNLLLKEDSIGIMVSQVQNIANVSKDWELSKEQRQSLYLRASEVL